MQGTAPAPARRQRAHTPLGAKDNRSHGVKLTVWPAAWQIAVIGRVDATRGEASKGEDVQAKKVTQRRATCRAKNLMFVKKNGPCE